MKLRLSVSRFALLAAATMLLASVTANRLPAKVIENDTIPFDDGSPFVAVVTDPTTGDVLDILVLTGDLHVLITETVDGKGGVHLTFHFQPENFVGVGLVTGDTYVGTGITRGSTEITSHTFHDSYINNFHMVSTTGGYNWEVRDRIIVTVVDDVTKASINIENITLH